MEVDAVDVGALSVSVTEGKPVVSWFTSVGKFDLRGRHRLRGQGKAEDKDLALKLIDFVMSPEGYERLRAEAAFDLSLTELSVFVEGNRTVPFTDQLWPNPEVRQTMLSGLQEIRERTRTCARSTGSVTRPGSPRCSWLVVDLARCGSVQLSTRRRT